MSTTEWRYRVSKAVKADTFSYEKNPLADVLGGFTMAKPIKYVNPYNKVIISHSAVL